MPIARLEIVPLRELWRHEELGFSSWLESNVEVLSEAIGLTLTAVQREKPAGSFQVDLVAEDSDRRRVIIENQLEPTDHDHLGKVLTYLTNLDAKIAIWISSDPRPEHVRAISWLNEVTPGDTAFYLVRLQAYRIGASDPAPLFSVIVAPTAEAKDIGRRKNDLAEGEALRVRFWEQLLSRAKQKGVNHHASIRPYKQSWLGVGAGRAGVAYNYLIQSGQAAIELYIDSPSPEQNKRMFDSLEAQKADIELAFDAPLSWQRLDEARASRIRYVADRRGLREDERNWPAVQDAMIDAMDRFVKALRPRIQAVRLSSPASPDA
jgi:hypothetical protein